MRVSFQVADDVSLNVIGFLTEITSVMGTIFESIAAYEGPSLMERLLANPGQE